MIPFLFRSPGAGSFRRALVIAVVSVALGLSASHAQRKSPEPKATAKAPIAQPNATTQLRVPTKMNHAAPKAGEAVKGKGWKKPSSAPVLPPGFFFSPVNAPVGTSSSFNLPTSIAIAPDGRIFVCEKYGYVKIIQNGQIVPQPFLDISIETQTDGDRGLTCMALDPNFATNGYVYFIYIVNPDSNGISVPGPVFGRVVRYTASTANPNVADPSTRTILIGKSWEDGVPDLGDSHTADCLRFAPDGTLLMSCGEGANFDAPDAGGLNPAGFIPGRFDTSQDIGAFRAQYLGSYGGKILRFDPATGNGLPSNPFYTGNPTDIQSHIWAYGLRNPFRFNIRPGTSSTNPADAKPGVLYIGNVGWNTWENIEVAPNGGGVNFGWPCYEGPYVNTGYDGYVPSHNDCTTIGTPINPAPWKPPLLTYNHFTASLSIPPGTAGDCTLGAIFYTGDHYPAQYKGGFFYTDLTGWLNFGTVDSTDSLLSVTPFATGLNGAVDMATDPKTGDIYFVSIYDGEVTHLEYDSLADIPTGLALHAPASGPPPLGVSFIGSTIIDPANSPLTYAWNFGDSITSSAINPFHTYSRAGNYIASVIVVNQVGFSNTGQFCVSVDSAAVPGYDVTAFGSATAFITSPTGQGNHNLSVISDNVFPPVGNTNFLLQYDTYNGGNPRAYDWIGYTFDSTYTFSELIYQEGKNEVDGGWFDSLGVEVLSGGVWLPVANIRSSPNYRGNDSVGFKTFVFSFTPQSGNGIRLYGVPGGTHYFTSVGELRAIAAVAKPVAVASASPRTSGKVDLSVNFSSAGSYDPSGGQLSYVWDFGDGSPLSQLQTPLHVYTKAGVFRALLTCVNSLGATDTTGVTINALSALPPTVSILYPRDSAHVDVWIPENFAAVAHDNAQADSTLLFDWELDLVYNDHSHPGTESHNTPSFTTTLGPGHHIGRFPDYEWTLKVTDSSGLSTVDTLHLFYDYYPVLQDSVPPGGFVAPPESTFNFSATFSEFTVGDTLRFSILSMPHWLAQAGAPHIVVGDSITGTWNFSGVPSYADIGDTILKLCVIDTVREGDTLTVAIHVPFIDRPPLITSLQPVGDTVAHQDSLFTLVVTAADSDIAMFGDSLFLNRSLLPGWLHVDSMSGPGSKAAFKSSHGRLPHLITKGNSPGILDVPAVVWNLSGTPTAGNVGDTVLVLKISDKFGGVDSVALPLHVRHSDHPPHIVSTLAGTDTVAQEDSSYQFTVQATDVDQSFGDSLSLVSIALPSWLHITALNTPSYAGKGVRTPAAKLKPKARIKYSAKTLQLPDSVFSWVVSGTPGGANVGDTVVALHVVDNAGLYDSLTFALHIVHTDHAPEIVSSIGAGDTIAHEDSLYQYVLQATDPDFSFGDSLSLTALVLPSWLDLETPSIAHRRPNEIATRSLSARSKLAIRVLGKTLQTPDSVVSWNVFGTPGAANIGDTLVELMISDRSGLADTCQYALHVLFTDHAPVFVTVIADSMKSAHQDSLYILRLRATDSDIKAFKDSLSIRALALPSWLTLSWSSADTGGANWQLSGVPAAANVGDTIVNLAVIDRYGRADTLQYQLVVAHTNHAPRISSFVAPADTVARQDSLYQFVLAASDVDVSFGDSLQIQPLSLPSWLSISPLSVAQRRSNSAGSKTAGVRTSYPSRQSRRTQETADSVFTWEISGTPGATNVGDTVLSVAVIDRGGLADTLRFDLDVLHTNHAPKLVTQIPDSALVAREDTTYSLTLRATDPDIRLFHDTLSLTGLALPSWLSIEQVSADSAGTTWQVAGTPTRSNIGDSTVVLVIMDKSGSADSVSFRLNVKFSYHVPQIASASTPSDSIAHQDSLYQYELQVDDGDAVFGDTLTVEPLSLPSWLTVSTLSSASPGAGLSISANPRLRTPAKPGKSKLKTQQTVDTVFTWLISGTPTAMNVGDTVISLKVLDAAEIAASLTLGLHVLHTDHPPVFSTNITDPMKNGRQDSLYNITLRATDVDIRQFNDSLSMRALALPSWLSIRIVASDSSGFSWQLSGVPGAANVGDTVVTIVVSDRFDLADTVSYSLNIAHTNHPPRFVSGVNASDTLAHEDSTYSYIVQATDVDFLFGDSLRLMPLSLPSWLNVSQLSAAGRAPAMGGRRSVAVKSSGKRQSNRSSQSVDSTTSWVLSGVPGSVNVGDTLICLEVSDRGGLSDTLRFTLHVMHTDHAPKIVTQVADSLLTAHQDTMYTLVIRATDVDIKSFRDSLTLSGAVLPSWLSIHRLAGDSGGTNWSVAGTPGRNNIGDTLVVVIVADRFGLTDTLAYALHVNFSYHIPQIASQLVAGDSVAHEDSSYGFAFQVFDGDALFGDTLRFVPVALPSWLSVSRIARADLKGAGSRSAMNMKDKAGTAGKSDKAFQAADTIFEWLISGVPGSANVGDTVVSIQVIDNANLSANQTFTLHVFHTDHPPKIVSTVGSSDTVAHEDSSYQYVLQATDPDFSLGDSVRAFPIIVPSWLQLLPQGAAAHRVAGKIASVSRSSVLPALARYHRPASPLGEPASSWILSGTPTAVNVGDTIVELRVVDNSGLADTLSFTLDVLHTNHPPKFSSVVVDSMLIAHQDSLYAVSLRATDSDIRLFGDSLRLQAIALPSWLSAREVLTDMGGADWQIAGIPGASNVGDTVVSVVVVDRSGLADTLSYALDIMHTNHPPRIDSPLAPADTIARQDSLYNLVVTASDIDVSFGDSLSLVPLILPSWLNVAQPSVAKHKIAPAAQAALNSRRSHQPRKNTLAVDSTFSWELAGTPGALNVGDTVIALEVIDRGGLSDSIRFTMDVLHTDHAPRVVTQVSPLQLVAHQDTAYALILRATDADIRLFDDSLKMYALVLPSWLAIQQVSSDTGGTNWRVSGTPGAANVGDTTVSVRVADKSGLVDSLSLSITVLHTNHAPRIVSQIADSMKIAHEDSAFTLTVRAIDVDIRSFGDSLTMSGVVIPSWLSLHQSEADTAGTTWELSGIPRGINIGDTEAVVRVTDRYGLGDSIAVSLTVEYSNHPPRFVTQVVPSDSVAHEDSLYRLQVQAEDVDLQYGDSLHLAFGSLPSWLQVVPTPRAVPHSVLALGSGRRTTVRSQAHSIAQSVDSTLSWIISGTPAYANVGDTVLTLYVIDAGGLRDTFGLSLHVEHTNHPPAPFQLTRPGMSDTLSPTSSSSLIWRASHDKDPGDTLKYAITLTGPGIDTTFAGLHDTSFALPRLGFDTSYAWWASVSDGQIVVPSIDTLSFRTQPFTFFAASGWNMLSLPLTPYNPSLAQVYSTAVSPAMAFANGYDTAYTLQKGAGYWLKLGASSTLPMQGQWIAADTISVSPGWNLLGGISSPTLVGQVLEIPPGIISSLFFGYAGGYNILDTIAAGYAFWVKTSTGGKLALTSSQSAAPHAAPKNSLSKETLSSFNSLTLTSSSAVRRTASKGATLYFSDSKSVATPAKLELPPKPPLGNFDARFADGTAFKTLLPATSLAALNESAIDIQWDGGQVNAAAHMMEALGIQYYLIERTKGKLIKKSRLVDGNPMVLDGSGKSTYALVAERLPLAYKLYQNFPNPFNPTTTIQFDLPEPALVTLSVFNVLGQEVASLVHSARMEAGTQMVTFDAHTLASGVYFYRLSAANYQNTMKLLLLK